MLRDDLDCEDRYGHFWSFLRLGRRRRWRIGRSEVIFPTAFAWSRRGTSE